MSTDTAEARKTTQIRLPYRCRPSKACSRDDSRPLFGHAWLKGRDDGMWLLATDSYVAVALKVTGDELVEGFIPFAALGAIERQELVSQVSPTAWVVAHDGMTEVTYDVGDRLDFGSLPDFDKVCGGALFADGPDLTGAPFAIGARNLRRIGKALGNDVLQFRSGGGEEPVRVLGQNQPECRGLLMPIRVISPEAGR